MVPDESIPEQWNALARVGEREQLRRAILQHFDPEDGDFDFAGRRALIAAIELNLHPLVHELVAMGIPAGSVPDDVGYSPLCLAIAFPRCDAELVGWLLDHGATPHEHSAQAWTCLHLAVQCDRPDLVRVLLQHRAQIEARDGDLGQTPVEAAARQGRINCFRELVQWGAAIHTERVDQIAAKRSREELVRVLQARHLVPKRS